MQFRDITLNYVALKCYKYAIFTKKLLLILTKVKVYCRFIAA